MHVVTLPIQRADPEIFVRLSILTEYKGSKGGITPRRRASLGASN